MARRPAIIRRLDAALDKMRGQGMAVRAIYLTPEDWDAYNAACSKAYGSTMFCFRHGDIEIRSGKNSAIYSKHGVGISLPKRA